MANDIGCCGYRDSMGGCEGGNALITIGIVLCFFFLPVGIILIVVGYMKNQKEVDEERRDRDYGSKAHLHTYAPQPQYGAAPMPAPQPQTVYAQPPQPQPMYAQPPQPQPMPAQQVQAPMPVQQV